MAELAFVVRERTILTSLDSRRPVSIGARRFDSLRRQASKPIPNAKMAMSPKARIAIMTTGLSPLPVEPSGGEPPSALTTTWGADTISTTTMPSPSQTDSCPGEAKGAASNVATLLAWVALATRTSTVILTLAAATVMEMSSAPSPLSAANLAAIASRRT